MYTRNGEFRMDENGYLVDARGRKVYGYKVSDSGEAITSSLVPITNSGETDVGWIYKGDTGVLINNYTAYRKAVDNNDTLPTYKSLYKVALTSFPNRTGLLQNDGTTFKETSASGKAYEPVVSGEMYGSVHSQSSEKSNVFYIGEMMEALAVQRAMSASLTAVKLANQLIQNVIQQLGT